MAIIDLKTNLKSLKYGKDQFGGGKSNQPYIQTEIPDELGGSGLSYQDFILRGGSGAVTNSLIDVERLGRFFVDTKNPSGILFTAKQNLLSRTAAKTQTSGFLNEGVYTPLSTLAQAGGNAFGLHVNKQGLNPFASTGPTSDNENLYGVKVNYTQPLDENRLYKYYNEKILKKSDGILTSYPGGPGSDIGIGNTNIRFADQRTGINNINYYAGTEESFWTGTLNYYTDRTSSKRNLPIGASRLFVLSSNKSIFPQTPPPLTFITNPVTGDIEIAPDTSDPNLTWSNLISPDSSPSFQLPITPSVYQSSFPDKANKPGVKTDFSPSELSNQNNTYTYTQQDLNNIPNNDSGNGESFYIGNRVTTNVGDFRSLLRKNLTPNQKLTTQNIGNLANAPNYIEKNIENRVNLGDPGNRNGKNLTSYVVGADRGAASSGSYDKVNALPIYLSDIPDPTYGKDLIKFRIGVINNDDPSQKTYIHFRAFLDQISDAYAAEWNDIRYIGRGEKFYNYTGFDRKVSLSWTVAAQSKAELIPMYKKLNYLASVCAPDYSSAGYMRGNIVTLTVGGYLHEQPGIITGFSYEMNDENSTWEIGIDSNTQANLDTTVKELPHIIKVTGFNFIPIHTFVPKLQSVEFNPEGDVLTDNNTYGPERYIALKDDDGDTNYGKPIN